jgi:predicted ABC-class ATPase
MDEHRWIYATNKALLSKGLADAVKASLLSLADMRKDIPKPSEIIKAVKADEIVKAKELISEQEEKRQAIKDSGLVKHINNTRKNFAKNGVVHFDEKFGEATIPRELTAVELEAEANLALVLIAKDRKTQDDINSACGYKFPDRPLLHVEVLQVR